MRFTLCLFALSSLSLFGCAIETNEPTPEPTTVTEPTAEKPAAEAKKMCNPSGSCCCYVGSNGKPVCWGDGC